MLSNKTFNLLNAKRILKVTSFLLILLGTHTNVQGKKVYWGTMKSCIVNEYMEDCWLTSTSHCHHACGASGTKFSSYESCRHQCDRCKEKGGVYFGKRVLLSKDSTSKSVCLNKHKYPLDQY